jgi:hypothetical protein
VSELAATVRETLAALAAADPSCARFGAAHHRYHLRPPAAISCDDPDLATFVSAIGSGGAGPYYGWLEVERALAARVETPAGLAIPIAHLGCGYAAVMPPTGEIWIDARALGIARPIAPSFTAFYIDWLETAARGRWSPAHVPEGACALPNALGGYFAAYEAEHGLEPGTLAGAALREALGRLGPGAIQIAGAPPLFDTGDRVDPCVNCARLIENLAVSRDLVAPGVAPLTVR